MIAPLDREGKRLLSDTNFSFPNSGSPYNRVLKTGRGEGGSAVITVSEVSVHARMCVISVQLPHSLIKMEF